MPGIKHPEHKHRAGSHKMTRLYSREKVNGKYLFISIGWMCIDCGYFLMESVYTSETTDLVTNKE
jgi:hypothetical protein